MGELSKSQIDKLGDRLRQGSHSDDDLRVLDEFRRSFGPAFQSVLRILHRHSVSPLERPAKSTPSIIAKLQRQKLKLSRMQDIAGCRIIVKDRLEQDRLLGQLRADFAASRVKDRRSEPSHGYRAVHLIPRILDKPIEVQIRTGLQQSWAELSEKAFDVVDPAIKYGASKTHFQGLLFMWSEHIHRYEIEEFAIAKAEQELSAPLARNREALSAQRDMIFEGLKKLSELADEYRKKGIP